MAEEIKTDRNGDVAIRLGNKAAKVKPESLGVWLSRGWKIGEAEDLATSKEEVLTVNGEAVSVVIDEEAEKASETKTKEAEKAPETKTNRR